MSKPETTKPVYCPRRRQHDAECETPNSCAGGIDCRLGPDLDSQRVTPRTTLVDHVAQALARAAGWVKPLAEMEAEFVLGYQRRAKAAIAAVDEWRSVNET